jgi:hypothetical protein
MSAIESAFRMNDFAIGSGRPQRFVSFQKGVARMTFNDGSGYITLHSFVLADGQLCVKAEYTWTQTGTRAYRSIYPSNENFDWQGAAFKLAEGWMDGPPQDALPVSGENERLQAAI